VKTVPLKLTDAPLRKLERAARKRGQSKSAVIRSALEQYLNGERAIPPGSALEAALPWVGCCEGPGDLDSWDDNWGRDRPQAAGAPRTNRKGCTAPPVRSLVGRRRIRCIALHAIRCTKAGGARQCNEPLER
jgi:hypothetical protein